jgi:hypothetical protein
MSKPALLASTAAFDSSVEETKPRPTAQNAAAAAPRGRIPGRRPRSPRRQQRGDNDANDGDGEPSRASKIYLTTAQLRRRWGGCSAMFIERRLKDDPAMPRPMKLGLRIRFFDLNAIENYERSQIHRR